MSRVAQRGSATSPRRAGEDDDVCPVCKARRYLNNDMKYLINPECYHKMCQACVERIFTRGPAPCPIVGCKKTLRKNKFRPQKFEDLKVEREVDIRKRMAKIFNRREDEFETLMDYNNYLNEVEDMTFNLINKIDVEETEAKIRAYQAQHQAEILNNESFSQQEELARRAREEADAAQALERRRAAREADEQELRAKNQARSNVINQLASGEGNADQIASQGRVVLKKSLAQRMAAEKRRNGGADTPTSITSTNGAADSGFAFKGLKKKVAPVAEKPFDPFDGVTVEGEYFVLQDHYDWEWLDSVEKDPQHMAGGYDLREYYTRALYEAFGGFGVFIGEDVSETEMVGADSVATVGSVSAAVEPAKADVRMEDVF